MGLFSKVVTSGIAVKLVNEARKPHNQQKAKDAFASLRNRRRGAASDPAPRTPEPDEPQRP